MLCALLLLLLPLPLEFETILSATGVCLNISGATIFPTFTVPIKIIKTTMATNPALASLLAHRTLLSNANNEEIANRPTIGTAEDTKTDLLGNSKGEKDEIVKSIKIPEITVASTMIMSLALRLEEELDEASGEEEEDDDEDPD
jgi:hypothetical protein